MRTGYLGCVRAIRRKLKEIQPDIVHGQGTERECALSAVFSGYPNVLTIHGNMRAIARGHRAPIFSFYWLAARLEGFVLPRTNGVVCITTYTRNAVESLARKTWIVPNAVDASFFEVMRRPDVPPRIICVGNILKLKNQLALIEASDALQEPKKFELIFFGLTYRNKAYSHDFLEAVASRPWCKYEGFVDREGLKLELAMATGLIHPTLEDNCPMVILEAMAAGVPIAASRIGGIPDLIRDEETGLLFDPLDGQAMTNALEDLLGNATQERAVRAREEAQLRFHPRVIARRHVEIYEEVLSSASVARGSRP
jgi:glycosyltransferase involved in cell wall biosynthesis